MRGFLALPCTIWTPTASSQRYSASILVLSGVTYPRLKTQSTIKNVDSAVERFFLFYKTTRPRASFHVRGHPSFQPWNPLPHRQIFLFLSLSALRLDSNRLFFFALAAATMGQKKQGLKKKHSDNQKKRPQRVSPICSGHVSYVLFCIILFMISFLSYCFRGNSRKLKKTLCASNRPLRTRWQAWWISSAPSLPASVSSNGHRSLGQGLVPSGDGAAITPVAGEGIYFLSMKLPTFLLSACLSACRLLYCYCVIVCLPPVGV